MNTHSPFIPQGSFLERRRFTTRVVIYTVLAAHVVLLSCLLIQGCKPSQPETEVPNSEQVSAPPAAPLTNAQAAPFPPPTLTSNVPTPSAPPIVPPSAPVVMEPPVAPPVTKIYSVVRGDSFYKIARANGISINALGQANPGVDSRTLQAGQVLQLPQSEGTPGAMSPTTATALANHNPSLYVVRSGDTLSRISKAHGTTIKALKAANGLKTDQIVAGRRLKLPESSTPVASAVRLASVPQH